MEVNKIECPSCGSGSTFKVSEGEYKCNYCQGNFRVTDEKNSKIDFRVFLDEIKEEKISTPVSAPLEEFKAAQVKSKTTGIIILMVVIMAIGGIVSFTITRKSMAIAMGSAWQTPSRDNYKCFLGSKGPVIFLLMQQSTSRLDSARYFVKLIDPEKNKTLAEMPFGPTILWKDHFGFYNRLESDFNCFNDIAYNTPKDSGLIGFDIYTFKEVVTSSTLPKQFPELGSGISTADYSSRKNGFTITSNTSEEFIYNAEHNSLRKKEHHGRQPKDTVVTQPYLSKGHRPQLFILNRELNAAEDETRVNENFARDYEDNRNWYKKSLFVYDVKKAGDRIFFMANVLGRYKGGLLILYTEDLSKTSPVILELVAADGKTLWQNKDQALQALKGKHNGSEVRCDAQISGDRSAITIKDKTPCTLGIDMTSGKVAWTYVASN